MVAIIHPHSDKSFPERKNSSFDVESRIDREGKTEIDEMCYVRLYIRGQPVNRRFDGKNM